MIFTSTSCLKGRVGRYEKDIFHILDQYQKNDIRDIELGSALGYFDDIPRLIQLKKEHDFNFIMHCYFPPLKKPFMMNLASGNARTRQNSLDIALNAIDLCRRLDSDLYTIHPGSSSDSDTDLKVIGAVISYEDAYQNLKSSILVMLDKAKENKIKLGLENMPSMAHAQIFSKAEEFVRLFDDIGSKDLGMLLDIGHLGLASQKLGFSKEDFISKIKDKIFEFHCHQTNEGVDHNSITSPKLFDVFPKEVLKRSLLTLESHKLSIEDIKNNISLMEKVV